VDCERWEIIAVVADILSAQALVGLLASEGIRARVQADSELLGAARRCHVLVPRKVIDRARCLLWQTRFSDEELAALAMGEPVSEAHERD
jgi:hypothetical protein